MKRNIINLIMFQIGWFACVLGAANGQGWLGIVIVGVLTAIHIATSQPRKQEIILLLAAGVVGYIWESLLFTMSIIAYPGHEYTFSAPLWMAALWINFAITLNVSLAWFKQHLVLAGLAGMISAPLAYYAGDKLGAISFPDQWLALAIIGIGWAFLFPFLSWFAHCLITNSNMAHRRISELGSHV